MSCQRVDTRVSEGHCGYTSFHKYVITIDGINCMYCIFVCINRKKGYVIPIENLYIFCLVGTHILFWAPKIRCLFQSFYFVAVRLHGCVAANKISVNFDRGSVAAEAEDVENIIQNIFEWVLIGGQKLGVATLPRGLNQSRAKFYLRPRLNLGLN